ncbi:hypothetical protein CDL15_Pgr012800 [Punica granatum]|uniref:Uncharacterized protein n=1 Tax=Punica granatum TaxID=22663 RepID=A0A218XF51_PUNGR|nr:hypothetical protein CDL15_Pgr012800 [Punica granatum]
MATRVKKAVIDDLLSFLNYALIAHSLGCNFFLSVLLPVFTAILNRRAAVRLQLIDGGVKVQHH